MGSGGSEVRAITQVECSASSSDGSEVRANKVGPTSNDGSVDKARQEQTDRVPMR